MLALATIRDYACPSCGGDLRETTQGEDEWIPTDPERCHACTAIAEKQSSGNWPMPQALRFGAVRNGSGDRGSR